MSSTSFRRIQNFNFKVSPRSTNLTFTPASMPHSKLKSGSLGVPRGLATRLTLALPLKSKAARRASTAALPDTESTGAAPMPSSTQKSVGLCAPCGSATLKTSPPTLISKAARRASEAQFPNTDAVCATVAALARSVKGARPSAIAKHASRRKDHRRSSKSPPLTTTVNQTFYVNFPSPQPTK